MKAAKYPFLIDLTGWDCWSGPARSSAWCARPGRAPESGVSAGHGDTKDAADCGPAAWGRGSYPTGRTSSWSMRRAAIFATDQQGAYPSYLWCISLGSDAKSASFG